MAAIVAVDAGQRRITTRALGASGPLIQDGPGLDAHRPLAPQWASAVTDLLDAHPDLQVAEVAVSSCSGAKRSSAHDLLAALPAGIRRAAVAPNSVAAYLGALGEREGAVLYADTVTVCLACGPSGVARVDGWGPIFGNAGSAFWIGRNAIEAALRGYDGRRQLTSLTDLVRADFPELESDYLELQASPTFVPRIAAVADRVFALAPTDRVAANILDKAAAHLSEAVQAAIRRSGLMRTQPPTVVAVGSVLESDAVRRRVCDYLSLQWPSFALTEPAGDELDGAAALLTLAPAHPLFGQVCVAER